MSLLQSSELLAQKVSAYSAVRETLIFPLAETTPSANEEDALSELISKVCLRILDEHPEIAAVSADKNSKSALNELIMQYAEEQSIRAGLYRQQLQQQVLDSLFGYGPLQYLVDDEDITDIDAVSPSEITVKKFGVRMRVSTSFESSAAYETFCRLLIMRQGGIINENDSHCRVTDADKRLRINVTVPPRSIANSCLSIRKHPASAPTLEDLAGSGMFEFSDIPLLAQYASSDKSILICGRGGSGKTTLLRALINAMPPLERILIAESDSEIYAEKSCCLSQRIRRDNEGGRPVSLRDLISDGLTMSLDTYCIGEIVGDEAYEFMRAAYSGHRCLATVHAISAEDAMDRIISLARTAAAGEHEQTMKNMLARSVDVIIHLNDFRISKIIAVKGYNKKGDFYEVEIVRQAQNTKTGATADNGSEQMVSG